MCFIVCCGRCLMKVYHPRLKTTTANTNHTALNPSMLRPFPMAFLDSCIVKGFKQVSFNVKINTAASENKQWK